MGHRRNGLHGAPGGWPPIIEDPFIAGTLEKPVMSAAVNGSAMGGGFMLVDRTDLRVAVIKAVFGCIRSKALDDRRLQSWPPR